MATGRSLILNKHRHDVHERVEAEGGPRPIMRAMVGNKQDGKALPAHQASWKIDKGPAISIVRFKGLLAIVFPDISGSNRSTPNDHTQSRLSDRKSCQRFD